MQHVLYYLKQSVITFIYLFGTVIIAVGINLLNTSIAFKIVLHVLDVTMYFLVLAMFYFVIGKRAMTQHKVNNEEREEMLRTGELKPLNLAREYSPYKGIIVGLTPMVLMLIFLLMQLLGVKADVINVLLTVFYGTFYLPLRLFEASNYIVLYGLVITVIDSTIFYNLGAKYQRKTYLKVDKLDKEIYGDKK